jgi:hypothetical protein
VAPIEDEAEPAELGQQTVRRRPDVSRPPRDDPPEVINAIDAELELCATRRDTAL